MKRQSLFSGKNKKSVSNYRLLYFLPSMLSVKKYIYKNGAISVLPGAATRVRAIPV